MDQDTLIQIGSGAGSLFLIACLCLLNEALKTKLLAMIKKMFGKRSHSPSSGVVRQNTDIDRLLFELRYEFEADRVFLWRFHNGSHFSPDKASAIWRLSQTHEVLNTGISSEAKTFQNVLFSLVNHLVGPCITGSAESQGVIPICRKCGICSPGAKFRHAFFVDISALPECYAKQLLMTDMGVRGLMLTNLHLGGDTFGIVGMQWCGRVPDVTKFTDAQIKIMCTTAESLQYLARSATVPSSVTSAYRSK